MAHLGLRHAGPRGVVRHVHPLQVGHHVLQPGGVLGQPAIGQQAVLHQRRQQRRQQVGVAARPRAQPDAPLALQGQVRGLSAPGVHHHEDPARVVGDLLQDPPGLREAVRLPRVLAPEHRDLGVLVVARGVAAGPAEQLAVHPEFAGLLLGEGVGAELDAQRCPERAAVAAAEMVALPAAAVEEDAVPAVLGDDVLEAGGDLGDGRVPVDLLERAVRPAAQGRGQPVRVALVMADPQTLLARVALRAGVGLVAADPGDGPALCADLQPAVDAAEDAGGGVPGVGHRGLRVSSTNEPSIQHPAEPHYGVPPWGPTAASDERGCGRVWWPSECGLAPRGASPHSVAAWHSGGRPGTRVGGVALGWAAWHSDGDGRGRRRNRHRVGTPESLDIRASSGLPFRPRSAAGQRPRAVDVRVCPG